MSIKGGNRLIFEEFVKRSKAAVHLETQVKRITKLPSKNGKPQWEVQYVEDGLMTAEVFDAVILAAPFASSGVEVVNTDAASLIPPLPYVDLHVTLVRTNASAPQSCFFNPAWSCSLPAPNTVYTALDAHEQGRIATRPVINSLNYLKELQDGSYLVKLFSRATLTPGDLARAFGNVGLCCLLRECYLPSAGQRLVELREGLAVVPLSFPYRPFQLCSYRVGRRAILSFGL
jgi:prenylcysteine oxidase/farnesylcysteine lyase